MRRQLLPGLAMILVFTAICGLAYPLLVTGVAQTAFKGAANGSLIKADGKVVGSRWIGQNFTKEKYFHPRPAADGYVAGAQGGGTASYGSNYGPTNHTFLYGEDDPSTKDVDESKTTGVDDRVRAYRKENGLSATTKVPVDAVTASASGLDPAISVANARIQARRVAGERHLPLGQVLRLVEQHTDPRGLDFLGEPAVNVLELNLALDRM